MTAKVALPTGAFLSSQRCCGEVTAQKCWLIGVRLATRGHQRPGLLSSEVLLPPLLGFNSIQDGLPLGPVLLPDLFHFLFHHGVEGREPLLKVLHSPTLKLEEKRGLSPRCLHWEAQPPPASRGKAGRRRILPTESRGSESWRVTTGSNDHASRKNFKELFWSNVPWTRSKVHSHYI